MTEDKRSTLFAAKAAVPVWGCHEEGQLHQGQDVCWTFSAL
jgi:hypothetical protein